MKKKWFKNKPLIDSIMNTSRFKILMFLLIALALFAAFNFNEQERNLFSGIIYCHSNMIFILLFHAFFLLVTINTCVSFYEHDTYLIRLQNKKNVIKKLIGLVLQINGILLLCYFFIYLCLNNLIMLGSYDTKEVFNYGIKTNIYAIYIMIKFYLLAILFMVLNTTLFVILKESKTVILNVLYLIGFLFITPPTTIKFSLMPWNYYYLLDYHTFPKEMMNFIIFVILFILFIIILGILGTKQKRRESYEN